MYSNADCTVFNRIYDHETREDRWQYTHLKEVFWENRKGANTAKSGMREADSVIIYIPLTVKSENQYRPPKEFKQNPDGGFTLRPEDKIVKGLVKYNGPIAKLPDTFDNVVTITSVDTMDYGSRDMQHWEVGGI